MPLTVCAAECEITVQEFLQWHHNLSQIYEEHRHLAIVAVSSWNDRVHSMKNKRGSGKSYLLTYQDKSLINTSVSDKNCYRNLKWSHIFFTLPQSRSFSFLKFWFQNYNHFILFCFVLFLFYTALFKIGIPAGFFYYFITNSLLLFLLSGNLWVNIYKTRIQDKCLLKKEKSCICLCRYMCRSAVGQFTNNGKLNIRRLLSK